MTNAETFKCDTCREGTVRDAVIAKDVEIRHEGRMHSLHLPQLDVSQCDRCGEVYTDNRADRQILGALRIKLGLLSPEDIVAMRECARVTQSDVQRDTGIAAETLSRWENGHVVQSKALDRLLRVYLADPAKFREAVYREAVHASGESDQTPTLPCPSFQWSEVVGDPVSAANCNYALAA